MSPQSDDSGLVEDFIMPLPSLSASTSPGIVYVSYTRENPEVYALGSYACTLKFISKEVDPSTGEPEEEGYEDEYQLEEVELSAGGDYIIPSYATFGSEWDRMRSAPTSTETFALSAMESIKGMFPFRSTDYGLLTCPTLSCVRVDHRSAQHGTSGRHRNTAIGISAYSPTFRSGNGWRWKSVGSLSYDILKRSRRNARAFRAG